MSAPTTTVGPETNCWSCSATTGGAHFCPACGKIQPFPQAGDYFAFFDLPRKLTLDADALEQRFHSLSWKLHPDRFAQAPENERELSLALTSQLNDAYRTLRDSAARVEYLLSLSGMRKEGQKKQQAPPELLEEVFELNESLDELREARASGGDTATLKHKLEAAEKNFEEKLNEVDGELQAAARDWDKAIDEKADKGQRDAIKTKLNDLLNRRSYIRNLVVNVQKELL